MNRKENYSTFFYPEKEERLNVLSHGFAFLCSIVCFILLVIKGINNGSPIYIFSLTVFGIALMLTFITSTMYHKSKDPIKRNKYRMLDMFAIYT
ncbi:hemolysin III family protein, partial [Candidatus Marinimicrobia bacterium]|nr:hemolysin III family protein [Candidatus Neomarinimicrobiota bacterium]